MRVPRAVLPESPRADDAVDMGVEVHLAVPGVQDGEHGRQGVPSIGRDIGEGLCRGLEKNAEHLFGKAPRHGPQRLGQCEHNLEVRQHRLRYGLRPSPTSSTLAGGAVPVPT